MFQRDKVDCAGTKVSDFINKMLMGEKIFKIYRQSYG